MLDCAISSERALIKAIWFNLSVSILVLGSFEGYLYLYGPSTRIQQSYNPTGFFVPHDILGYAPRQKSRVTARKYYDNEVVYDVVYTINSDGLRISPPYKLDDDIPCIVFFGDSFTFGAGVNDTETMPYQVGIKTNGKYHINNFGFHGYGPHQMLAALEKGLVQGIVRCNLRYAVYQAILPHIGRAAGLASWDLHGPKYTVMNDSRVVHQGRFNDERNRPRYTIGERVMNQIEKSLTYRAMAGEEGLIRPGDVNLFIEIVHRAERMAAVLYERSEFHVIVWNYGGYRPCTYGDQDICGSVITGLRQRGIRVHLISDILQDYDPRNDRYHISKHDRHPDAVAHERIAEYVVNNIIARESFSTQAGTFKEKLDGRVRSVQSDHARSNK